MSQTMKVAIVDDEQDMRQSISQWLALSGFETETFGSAEDALKSLNPEFPGVVVSDIKMPGMDGMAFLKRLMSVDSALPVIMITVFDMENVHLSGVQLMRRHISLRTVVLDESLHTLLLVRKKLVLQLSGVAVAFKDRPNHCRFLTFFRANALQIDVMNFHRIDVNGII